MFKNSLKDLPLTQIATTLEIKIIAPIYRSLTVNTLTSISSGTLLAREKPRSIDFCSRNKKPDSLSLSSEL